MKEIEILFDEDGLAIRKGTQVFADGGRVQGPVTAIYDDNSVDIHHANAHQGPVIDSFDVTHNDVRVNEDFTP